MKHIIDDADKNKYEAFTKEEVLEVIQEAISSGELPDEINGLVLRFKNPVDNQSYKIAFCTQAKYNELESGGQLEANCIYYITDDTTLDDLEDYIDNQDEILNNKIDNEVATLNNKINGKVAKEVLYEDEDLGDFYSNIENNGSNINLSCEGDNEKSALRIYNDQINIISYHNDSITKSCNLFNLINVIPVDVPVTNTSIDITTYGAGLYMIVIEVSSGSYTHYTCMLSITDSGTVTTSTLGQVKNSEQLIYRQDATPVLRVRGYYYEYILTKYGAIELSTTGGSLSSSTKFVYCKRIIKY